MKRLIFTGLIAILLLSSFSGLAFAAPGVTDDAVLKELAAVRKATAKYHDVTVAEADGFIQASACTAVPGLGGMGIHYVNFGRMDLSVNALEPEVLLYAPTADGLKLVGVEYFMPYVPVFPVPQLFGRPFDGPMPGHDEHMPVHYDLHVWLWQANPTGIFSIWNPNVGCE